jgi:thymidylate synthase (FAD)
MSNPSPAITFTSESECELIHVDGSDLRIIQSARVDPHDDLPREDLINTLMRSRHGTPFEHGYLQFHIKTPIFVSREIVRSRIGVSINEVSGRYKRLKPTFWLPAIDRPYIPSPGFNPMRPDFIQQTLESHEFAEKLMVDLYSFAWSTYTTLLESGVAKEVARTVLPVGIFTEMMISFNPRSLMHFLSLRTFDPDSKYPSYVQAETEAVARVMEGYFRMAFPVTYAAFVRCGRVAP